MALIKVTEAKARKAHSEGKRVWVNASQMNAGGKWSYLAQAGQDFKVFCDRVKHYNCGPECGRALHYHIEVED